MKKIDKHLAALLFSLYVVFAAVMLSIATPPVQPDKAPGITKTAGSTLVASK